MTIPRSLDATRLCRRCEPSQFSFDTTGELEITDDIIGQTRAVEAIRFGIGIHHDGFNLFALGPNGVGKQTALTKFLTQRAPAESTPDDWCYVNNFERPHKPSALRLPTGQGARLSQDMSELVEDLLAIIPAALNSEEYNAQKKAIVNELKAREARLLKELEDEAKAHNIGILSTPSGFAFAPLRGGEVISPGEFMRLTPAEQREIETKIGELQLSLQEIMRQVPTWHRETQSKLKKLQEEMAVIAITPSFVELTNKYETMTEVLKYLETLQQDVVANVDGFIGSDQESLASLVGIVSSGPPKRAIVTRYQVGSIWISR